jgi:hypothetical protein
VVVEVSGASVVVVVAGGWDVVVGAAVVVVGGGVVVVGATVVAGGTVVVGAAVVVVGGGGVVGSTQALPRHWLGGRQQLPLQQVPLQQPSVGQQVWPAAQQGVSGSWRQSWAVGQQVSSSPGPSPMHSVPAGQHSPSQH